jgi:HEPN domain-containing protein
MAAGDSPYAEDWKKVAQKDWGRMKLLLDSDDYEGAAYFLQQAVEKRLKAWLIDRGAPLRKTHELSLLLTEAAGFEPRLAAHEPICLRLAGYYFSQRYPTLIDTELSRADVEADMLGAEALLEDLFPGEPR